MTSAFGSRTTSSSDGIRFGVPPPVSVPAPPRYFGARRGLSVYSLVSHRGSQFWLNVINCPLWEATSSSAASYQDMLPILEHYTDTHGYTDLLFGLLGFRFAPRLRDLPDQTLYRARPGADYGPLNRVLSRRLRTELIVDSGGAGPPGRFAARRTGVAVSVRGQAPRPAAPERPAAGHPGAGPAWPRPATSSP